MKLGFRQRRGNCTIILLVFVLLFSVASCNKKVPRYEVPDFTSQTVQDARLWADERDIQIAIKYEYHESAPVNTVLAQNLDPMQTVSTANTIILVVSKGPQPVINEDEEEAETVLILPDFVGLNILDVKSWLSSENQQLNVNEVYIYHNTIAKGFIIATKPAAGTILNTDTLTLTISLGQPRLDDFSASDYSLLESQLKIFNDNGANINESLSYVYNSTVPAGKVISQSVFGILPVNSSVSVVVSLGPKPNVIVKEETKVDQTTSSVPEPAVLPDFVGKSLSEAKTWLNENSYQLEISYLYSSQAKDTIISQGDIPNDSTGKKIGLTVSLGEYKVPVFEGTLESAKQTLSQVATQGVTIELVVKEAASNSIPAGKLIGSVQQYDTATHTLTLTVSLGPSVDSASQLILSSTYLGNNTKIKILDKSTAESWTPDEGKGHPVYIVGDEITFLRLVSESISKGETLINVEISQWTGAGPDNFKPQLSKALSALDMISGRNYSVSYAYLLSPTNENIVIVSLSFYSLDSLDHNAAVSAAKEYVKTLSGKTDKEKIIAIHNYLVANTQYDMSALEAWEASGGTSEQGALYWNASSAYWALIEHKAMCTGYAQAFYLMAKEAGIPALVVYGSGPDSTHTWNLVRIDGVWYQVDTTFDDPVPDVAGRILDTYLLRPVSQGAFSNHYYNKTFTLDEMIQYGDKLFAK
ncbi:MAG: PASTA domain-containing protein [Erysipelotrichaceae bacterium]|nr:PASTA domain-containing protein [Erysipelotrichaceae bacterium]